MPTAAIHPRDRVSRRTRTNEANKPYAKGRSTVPRTFQNRASRLKTGRNSVSGTCINER